MQLNKTILCIQRSIFFTYILRSDIFFVFSLVYFRSLMLKTCIFFIIYRIVLYMPQSIYDNNFFFSYRCRRWIQNNRRQNLPTDFHKLRYYYLCSTHFENSQFMDPHAKKKKLIHSAVPTLFDVPNPPQPVTTKRKLPDYHPSPP